MELTVKGYAKINLALNILNKNSNNYHDLESIVFPLELHDSIEIKFNNKEDDFITCDNYKVGDSKFNSCRKVIDILRNKYKFKEHFDIFIHKNIFIQSGLGGGSGDAAAVLFAILKILKINLNTNELIDMFKPVGCDVPAAIFSKPCLVEGVGEKITSIEVNNNFFEYYVLLVKPKKGISTKEVYDKYDELEKNHFDIRNIINELKKDSPEIKEKIGNSLEIAANNILPETVSLKNDLEKFGFDYVFMSGGGSTYVALSKNKKLIKSVFYKYYKDSKNYETELTRFKQK